MKPTLDFFVIGAQKAGTTSLFKWLEAHPQLWLPPEKEAPFYSNELRWAQGLDWYLQTFFGGAPDDCLWGTVTPQYMLGLPDVPARIADTAPHARLVAVLRDPVARARSHHRMLYRRGVETRDFATTVRDELEPPRLAATRAAPTDANAVITQGEYGRILDDFLGHFPRQQLLVCWSRDLDRRPDQVLGAIYGFLGVDDSFLPTDLDERYHQGGGARRLPWLEDALRAGPAKAARRLLPGRLERRMRYWFKTWNAGSRSGGAPTNAAADHEAEEALRAHYRADRARLASIAGEPPWA